jgi:hypothetical protein
MSDHAKLSPSAAHGWMLCSARIEAEKGFPEESSPFADEGTAAHLVRAECLRDGKEPLDYLGDIVQGGTRWFLQTRARLLPLYAGIDRLDYLIGSIRRLREHDPRHCLIEERLYFSDRFLTDVWGTLDFGAFLERDGEITVSDLKFGMGHAVYPEHNEQQLIYAALFVDSLTRAERRRIRSIRIIIDQPRIARAGGEWVIDLAFLERWIDTKLYPAVERIKSKQLKFTPGAQQCFWCKAKRQCEAYQDFNVQKLGIQFSDERAPLSLPGLQGMSAERKADIVLHKSMLIDFLSGLEASVKADALRGDPTPGLKVVDGPHGKRVWIDEEKARRALEPHLGDKAVVTKTISPAKAEEHLPRHIWKQLSSLARRGESSPILVPESDPKPRIPPITFKDER